MEKEFHANTKQQKVGIATLIPIRAAFRENKGIRDEDGH